MAAKRAGVPLSPPPLKRKLESATTGKAVANFFKPASQKEPDRLSWTIVQKSLIVGRYERELQSQKVAKQPTGHKIAAFDLDDALIKSTTGQRFGKTAANWKWWDESVPAKLKELEASGYHIVILTNQGNISLKDNPKSLKDEKLSFFNFKNQLGAVLRQLGLPISVYAATEQDGYRKPRTGMWKTVLKDYGLETSSVVSMESSLFVGDAAGRDKTSTRLKDHACSDRDLAANIGLRFYTPEEYFRQEDPEPFQRLFKPSVYLGQGTDSVQPEEYDFKQNHGQDIVMFCGSPGAGKSSFFWKHLQPCGYQRINQDILKTRDKCLRVARDQLSSGKSVAIDNTNANVEARAHWVELAQSFKIPIRCVHFTASTRLCEHNDVFRALGSVMMNPEQRTSLPPIAFRSFASRYVEPSLSEGFRDIMTVNFKFEGTEEQKAVWGQFWVSKFST